MLDAAGTTVYSYDAAGQLLSEDGPWASDTVSYGYNNRLRTNLSLAAPNASAWTASYAYDAAKRLTKVTFPPDAPSGSKLKLLFGYDAQGRRISKTVSNWVSGAWQLQSTNRFVYDGWNLLAILNAQSSILASFTWGLDLSGSLQGAGGVGGLLGVTYYGTQTTNCFAAYDGNGNVAALVNAADGNVVARYEYGPFGEPLRATGPMAKANPFRFSTKYQDDETDLLYYGYRFYNQSTGRWPNRDPIEEDGGVNLYGFTENAPVNHTDLLGRETAETVGAAYQTHGALGHAAMEVGGKGYGFGPKKLRVFFTDGTTQNWESTAKPRTMTDLVIRKKGKFKDKIGGKCCDATLDRIIQCADHFKATWEGTEYRLSRNCRTYVSTIISSCCLSRGSSREEQEEGGAE